MARPKTTRPGSPKRLFVAWHSSPQSASSRAIRTNSRADNCSASPSLARCAFEPKVLLADEPISMLDVSVRLGVLNLLRGLCDNDRLAILYITHDIASARYIADSIIVMYAGQVVEQSRGTALVDEPTHPYTQLLIASVPDPSDPHAGPDAHRRAAPKSTIAETGCRFSPRCPHVMDSVSHRRAAVVHRG